MNEALTPTNDERTLGMVAHLLGFAGFVVPFGQILGPLILWQIKKNDSAYITEHAKEALNFQISLLIYALVGAFFLCLSFVIVVTLPLAFVVWGALALLQVVCMIIAAIKANDGVMYRYPMTIRLVH